MHTCIHWFDIIPNCFNGALKSQNDINFRRKFRRKFRKFMIIGLSIPSGLIQLTLYKNGTMFPSMHAVVFKWCFFPELLLNQVSHSIAKVKILLTDACYCLFLVWKISFNDSCMVMLSCHKVKNIFFHACSIFSEFQSLYHTIKSTGTYTSMHIKQCKVCVQHNPYSSNSCMQNVYLRIVLRHMYISQKADLFLWEQ